MVEGNLILVVIDDQRSGKRKKSSSGETVSRVNYTVNALRGQATGREPRRLSG